MDLAVEGLTDQQIALRLEISSSTVNSYWVRIRGKVGFLSRTELAAKVLRHASREEISRLEAEKEVYRLQLEERSSDVGAVRRSEAYRVALEAMPEPIVVINGEGRILFTNRMLNELFGYTEEELLDQPAEMLLMPSNREEHREQIAEFFRYTHPIRLGIDRVVYGRHKNGTPFRVMLILGSALSSEGRVATCIVRSFLNEIDTLRRRAAAIVA
ncbi:PAS domain S-box protein [bacterium]|nr:MAG: PAS domain S-box protein [bacterium]